MSVTRLDSAVDFPENRQEGAVKKIRVKVELILEVPDDWEPTEPNEDVGVHLKAGEALLQPEVVWVEFIGGNAEEGYNWDHIDDELDDQLQEMIVDGELEISNV
jgi:hypothetical protein